MTGIAYQYSLEFRDNSEEPKDLNFDSDNFYNPENSDYESLEKREHFFIEISQVIKNNEAIKPEIFCNVLSSEISAVRLLLLYKKKYFKQNEVLIFKQEGSKKFLIFWPITMLTGF
ncbi:hypothetical protein PHYBLDRAFT_163239 [Phycomyces blakesleeanus NRRL 1555(-)]|uniref:Uncharacterized protein n=1 Tax=Phycomyces blakesleeanus (strain ATCC 8743b / DSM 1359 / FGSC 10004 / NBRC 33097 / NRRL 1555) TaxID=763407 RepID=A0A167QSZ8_PHYB8|nr:hypothetical protein PHYBLDRAFT_163239 [Phycomyces blakesleeanus NRRL 1555(-)]OAD80211.1 hypothetical protein PHYBLDRAFT_163239 [Phycomyces blakesleeanus NRRL 1555(-)]|eukprot:XP_018298251.1 hypothetical protein PHYBLDRAFT_163239 [Phycomyces blakesleeanus NRRL 1555(-)]